MRWKAGEGDPYVLLASLLTEVGEAGPLPEIARQPGGKPYFPSHPDLYFSVSHSGPLSLCALGEAPVGADVELVRPRSEGLPRYVLSDGEYAWYRERGGRWEDFYTLWTLKEARVKCTGEGIFQMSPRRISVPLLLPGQTARWEGFSFTALVEENWRGAVCLNNL